MTINRLQEAHEFSYENYLGHCLRDSPEWSPYREWLRDIGADVEGIELQIANASISRLLFEVVLRRAHPNPPLLHGHQRRKGRGLRRHAQRLISFMKSTPDPEAHKQAEQVEKILAVYSAKFLDPSLSRLRLPRHRIREPWLVDTVHNLAHHFRQLGFSLRTTRMLIFDLLVMARHNDTISFETIRHVLRRWPDPRSACAFTSCRHLHPTGVCHTYFGEYVPMFESIEVVLGNPPDNTQNSLVGSRPV